MNQQIRIRTEKKIKENQTAPKHDIEINGRKYIVLENVFSPAIFLGTQWLINAVIKHSKFKSSILEIGVGCGCSLVEMHLSNKFHFIAGVDVNKFAVDNAIQNLKCYNLDSQIEVFQSNVLENQNIPNLINVIYWNYPFHPTSKNWCELSQIQKGVMDPQYHHLKKLIDQSLQRKIQEIYLGFSLTMGDFSELEKIVAQRSLRFQIVDQMQHQNKGTICLIRISLL